jgi:quercetin dioxygenase-like cupin family protein
MKVIKYSDARAVQELPGVLKREVITDEDGAPGFCMRVFEVEPGHSTSSHAHAWEHEVYILSGSGVVVSGDKETGIGKDCVIFIPPNEHHQLVNKSDEPLRFVCLIPNSAR